jgi:FkbM family methyltransferase
VRTAVGQVNTLRNLKRWKRHLDRLGVGDLPLVRGITACLKQRYLQPRDGSSDAIQVDLHGLQFSIPQRFVEHYLFQEYEPVTCEAFLGTLREGMVVIDVGAHIGYFTLRAAKAVGPAGRVHAVEPARENQVALEENIRLNRFENVTLHACAASKSRERRIFHLTGSSDSHGFYPHPCTETVQTIEIDVMPLDQLVQGPVDAIKIDVEGAEIEVLQGMSRVLAENSQIALCVEWNLPCLRNAGRDPCELPAYLLDLGFRKIQVLDDVEQRRRSLEDVLPLVRAREVPEIWYVNLWATRV